MLLKGVTDGDSFDPWRCYVSGVADGNEGLGGELATGFSPTHILDPPPFNFSCILHQASTKTPEHH